MSEEGSACNGQTAANNRQPPTGEVWFLLHCALSTSLSAMIILQSLVQLDLQPWQTFLANCVLV